MAAPTKKTKKRVKSPEGFVLREEEDISDHGVSGSHSSSERAEPDQQPLEVVVETGAPPDADLILVSTDDRGTPGELNSYVLRALEMTSKSLPSARDLADGSAAIVANRGQTLAFIVTVKGGERTRKLLQRNLANFLLHCDADYVTSIWLPPMGAGAGGLSVVESLQLSLRILAERIDAFSVLKRITVSLPPDISPSVLKVVEEIAKTYFSHAARRPARLRDAANMQYDRPTNEDVLGRAEFAKSLATRIDRLLSSGPGIDRSSLMIQLHAPWGAGKTSFMQLLSDRLLDSPEKWAVVWFNAWQNQRLNPPWWMLYDTIFRSLVRPPRAGATGEAKPSDAGALPADQRVWLRMKEFAWRLTVGNAVNLTLIVLGLIVVGALLHFAPSNWYDKPLAGLAALIGFLTTVGGIVRTGMGNLAAGTTRAAQGFVELTGDPMRKLRHHYERLLNSVDRRVLIIIDDLDRCTHTYVVQLLEGIQTIFGHPHVVWIVAADRRWLATAFEENFPKADSVAEPGNRLGYQFLEKAFQVSISLPRITNETKETYWRRVIGDTSAGVEHDAAAAERLKKLEDDLAGESSEGRILEILEKSAELPPEHSGHLRRAAVERMADAAVEASVQHFLTPFCVLIKSNPRAMKRLVNSYTIFRDLAVLSGLDLSEQSGRRHELARWTILTMDAPLLLDLLEEQPDLLKAVKGSVPELLPKGFRPLWRDPRIEKLIYGYEPINLGPLKDTAITDFSPLRG